jgi:hypothetical protein
MDSAFEAYFSERVSQSFPSDLYGSPPLPSSEPNFIVRDAINRAQEAALSQGYDGLRADAALLLYLSFTELVASPIIAVRGPSAGADLSETITSDVMLIANRAIEGRKGDGPASAHDIVNATARTWSELRSSNWQIWD